MWSSYLQTFALTNCFVTAGLAVAIFYTTRRSIVNKLLALCVFSFALWSTFLLLINATSSNLTVMLAFLVGGWISPLVYLFLEAFTGFDHFKRKVIINALPVLILSFLIMIPGVLFKQLVVSDGSIQTVEYGLAYFVYQSLFLYYFIRTIIKIIISYRATTGIKRLQLIYIALGIGVIFSIAALFYVVLPGMKIYDFIYMGPILSLVLALALLYGGTKHHIWEPKVVFSEIWALLLILVVFSWFWQNLESFNAILFVAVTSLCVLLTQSVLSESRAARDLRQQNIQLARAKRDLEKLDIMKDEFLQFASKQLNTPIAVIKKELSVIVEKNPQNYNDEQRAELAPVLEAADRLARFSKDLFNASFIEHGRILLNRVGTNVETLVEKATKALKEKARERSIVLRWKKGEQELPMLPLDAEKIYEVIYNLIENAIKYTYAGTVEVKTDCNDQFVRVSVADTGIGIPKEELDKIFTKFFQSGRTVDSFQSEGVGTGLGLYISKNIIELHGGKIEVESEEGNGSKFTISLPRFSNQEESADSIAETVSPEQFHG